MNSQHQSINHRAAEILQNQCINCCLLLCVLLPVQDKLRFDPESEIATTGLRVSLICPVSFCLRGLSAMNFGFIHLANEYTKDMYSLISPSGVSTMNSVVNNMLSGELASWQASKHRIRNS